MIDSFITGMVQWTIPTLPICKQITLHLHLLIVIPWISASVPIPSSFGLVIVSVHCKRRGQNMTSQLLGRLMYVWERQLMDGKLVHLLCSNIKVSQGDQPIADGSTYLSS